MAQASDIVNSNWSPGQAMPGENEPSVKVREPLLAEVLTKVNNAKTKKDKIKILNKDTKIQMLELISQTSFLTEISKVKLIKM